MIDNIIKILSEWTPLFLQGIGVTLLLALSGTIIGLFLGLGLAILRTFNLKDEGNKILKVLKYIGFYFAKVYVTIFRGTPMMVQAMIIYYGLGALPIFSWWTPNIAGIVVVSLNTAAYLAEVFRGGINSLDKGQTEAARSLGFNQLQTFVYIVLPQTVKNTFPSLGNEFIVNIKDTSVLSCIFVLDIFKYASLSAGIGMFVEAMTIAAVIYLCLTYSTSKVLMFIEKKWDMPVKEITSSN